MLSSAAALLGDAPLPLPWDRVAVDKFTRVPQIIGDERIVGTWRDVSIRTAEGTMWLDDLEKMPASEELMLTSRRLLWYAGELGASITLSGLASVLNCGKQKHEKQNTMKSLFFGHHNKTKGRDERHYEIEVTGSEGHKTWLCLSGKEEATEIDGLLHETWKAAIEDHKKASTFSASSAGVSGLLRRQRLRQAAAGQLAAETQSELNALIKHAGQVADMLQRYTSKSRTSLAERGIVTLGLSSFLSTENQDGVWTSAAAHDGPALARAIVALATTRFFQRSEQEEASLATDAAALSLADLYCAFNRARGIDLVSPNDFVNALSVFIDRSSPSFLQDSPLELVTFPSGVKVLRPTASRKQFIFDTLIAAAKAQTNGISAFDAADILHVPVTLAKQHLLDTEAHTAALCRDDALSGLRFYPNHFASFSCFALSSS